MPNLASINDMVAADLLSGAPTEEHSKQIYLACGKGNHGTIRQLTHGLPVSEKANTGLPIEPTKIITLKGKRGDQTHKYLIVSSVDKTLVLSVTDEKIVPAQDCGFQKAAPTLHAEVLEDGTFIQVTNQAVYHIDPQTSKSTAWNPDQGSIVRACSNSKQLVIQTNPTSLYYFELDQGQLKLLKSKVITNKHSIEAIEIGEVPIGRVRARFLFTACDEVAYTIRIMSLDSEDCLEQIGVKDLPSALPCSLALSDINNS